jgi:signal transduction histidine kinase
LNDLLDEVILLLSHKLKDKAIVLSRRYPAEPVLITGYENCLKQLSLNLVTNSAEAVLTGGAIEVAIEEAREMTKTNTGLGLSICQHIAKSHKGIITFESSPGEKTRYKGEVPRSLRSSSCPRQAEGMACWRAWRSHRGAHTSGPCATAWPSHGKTARVSTTCAPASPLAR